MDTLYQAQEALDILPAIAAIDTASEALNTAWQAASQDIYAATQEAGGAEGEPQANANGSAGDADTVDDVEFEEVDEKA